jgi:hypothetical protein
MSRPRTPQPAKLVIGMFTAEPPLQTAVAGELESLFGSIDLVSPWWPFDQTDYYRKEMGGPLYRRMFVFGPLVDQGHLAAVKQNTNRLEAHFAAAGRRRVNLDPGHLLMERFVLASGKNYTHRIYIGQGIYADLTLVYRRGRYCTLEWTYPDYAGADIRNFLGRIRKKYAFDLKRSAQQ